MVDAAHSTPFGTTARQLSRYAVVGLLGNGVAYGVYLLVTHLGVAPKLAISALYPIGATISFLCNRRATFGHRGNVLAASARYVLAHFGGLCVNLLLLQVFVDRLGLAHQAVQAAAVFVVAAFLFVTFKFYVFPTARNPTSPPVCPEKNQ